MPWRVRCHALTCHRRSENDRRGIPVEIAALVTAGLLLREPRAGKTGANRYTIDQTDRTDHRTDSAHRARRVHANGEGSASCFDEFWSTYPSRQPHQNPKKPA